MCAGEWLGLGKSKTARAELTKRKLLDVAFVQFAKHGFDGVSARNLASAACVPLSAIPYHFGTMQALYRATVSQVMDNLGSELDAAVEIAQHAALSCLPEHAAHAVRALLCEILRVMAVKPESADWARLLMREMQDPSEAFDAMYDGVMFRAHGAICSLIARATGRDAAAPSTALQAFALIGQVAIFRHIQPIVTKRMGWQTLSTAEFEQLTHAIRVELA
jgi:TetR/AcrR family transcriptional regulator, regulator of cefoperazone and chloramphenicol sensitivity